MSEHSPEPWEVTEVGAGEFFIVKFEPGGDGWEHSVGEIDRLEDARRIVACVNFCRQFPTDYLEGRQLVYIHSEDDLRHPKDLVPEGFVACTLLPIQKDNQP